MIAKYGSKNLRYSATESGKLESDTSPHLTRFSEIDKLRGSGPKSRTSYSKSINNVIREGYWMWLNGMVISHVLDKCPA